MVNTRESSPGNYVLGTAGWPQERWIAVIVLGALALLIVIRMGFRGISVMGASAKIG